MNRLADELSPYLQQHKDNPVDWYPWGEEALQRAATEDKPILVSIGYSACHWCHVMERESFADPSIAELMNRWFINIKVDREERPDLDQVYQLVVQLTRRSGGWPLTVFLTPDLKPFFGGTYFPPVPRHGMPGFGMVLEQLARAYRERRSEVDESASEIFRAIDEVLAGSTSDADPSPDFLMEAARPMASTIDPTHGGFGSAPKFPNTMNLEVLLRASVRHRVPRFLEQVTHTLDSMRDGGIYDQLGGGFHRYSTDARWLVPHFEKMLYDNALLARLHVDVWQTTGEIRYSATVREVLDYVQREMSSPEGAFYSTQDADSEGEEGTFFVWTLEQLRAVLGDDHAQVAALYFGVAPGGNFEHGASVLHVNRSIATVAEQLGKPESEVEAILSHARHRLFEAREEREKPFRDEKVIASWNGLMAGAFAHAGFVLDEPRYVDCARRALDFVTSRMIAHGNTLSRVFKDGKTGARAFLDDYAEIGSALIDLYEATGEYDRLDLARKLTDQALQCFLDHEGGGFFYSAPDQSDVLVRAKEETDNAVPAGASSMCRLLLRLGALVDEERYQREAERALRRSVERVRSMPGAFGHLLGAMDYYVHGATTVLIQGDELLDAIRSVYVPNLVLVRWSPGQSPTSAPAVFREHLPRDERPTALICQHRTCYPPVHSKDEVRALLSNRANVDEPIGTSN